MLLSLADFAPPSIATKLNLSYSLKTAKEKLVFNFYILKIGFVFWTLGYHIDVSARFLNWVYWLSYCNLNEETVAF